MSLDYSPEARRQYAHYKEIRKRLNPRPKPVIVRLVENPPEEIVEDSPVVQSVAMFCGPEQRDWLDVSSSKYAFEDVIKEVCKQFKVSRFEIESPSRCAVIIPARHSAMVIARHLTKLSLPQIAKRLGRTDHTTVLHAWRKYGHVMIATAEKIPKLSPLTVWVEAYLAEMAISGPRRRPYSPRRTKVDHGGT